MATAQAVPNRPVEVKRREMQEVKAPEMFQFTQSGQSIRGVLVSIEPTTVKGKDAIEYMFINETGTRFTCLGTADLNKKIHPGLIGHWLDIRYESDDSSFQKPGQTAMKVFKVLASKEREEGFDGAVA
jgi:hypothetical protein